MSVEIVPRWTGAKSLDQEIDQYAGLGGQIPVRGIKSVDAKLGWRVVGKHDLQPAGLDIGTDEECRKLGNAPAGKRRRFQDIPVVRTQHRADRYCECFTVLGRQLPSLQQRGVAVSQAAVGRQIIRHRRRTMRLEVVR